MRSRNIKPDFFTDEKLINLSYAERLFFIGLWCFADKDGFFEIKPHEMKLKLFPEQKIDIVKMLKSLKSQNIVKLHERHGYLPNFSKHQRPHPNEKKSDLKTSIKQNLVKLHEDSCNYTSDPSDIRNEDTRNEERGMRKAQWRLSNLWNNLVNDKLPQVSTVTDSRKKHIKSRMNDQPDKSYWQDVIQRILKSDFCCGDNDRGWRANFDWLVKPDTHVKVLEGKYNNTNHEEMSDEEKQRKRKEYIESKMGGTHGDDK